MKFINYLFMLCPLFLVSCEDKKGYEYMPAVASVINNEVILVCVTSDGTDLLADSAFIKNISVYGSMNKTEKKLKIAKMVYDDKEYCCISFDADLPDYRDMQEVSSGKTDKTETDKEMVGEAKTILSIGDRNIVLNCLFRYVSNVNPYDGNSSIYIERISYDDKVANIDNNNITTSAIVIKLMCD